MELVVERAGRVLDEVVETVSAVLGLEAALPTLQTLLADDWRREIATRVPGVVEPDMSLFSAAPARARKTASGMGGVNRDRVRWESVRAARRRRFFWEKEA